MVETLEKPSMLSCLDAMNHDHEEIETDDRDFLRYSGAKFILRMKYGLCFSQQACDEMISGVTELFSGIVSHLHQSVKNICSTAEDRGNLLDCIDDLFRVESNFNPFLGLSSRHHQLTYFKEKFNLLVSFLNYNDRYVDLTCILSARLIN